MILGKVRILLSLQGICRAWLIPTIISLILWDWQHEVRTLDPIILGGIQLRLIRIVVLK